MDLDLDTGRLIVFLTGFGFFLALESLLPARQMTSAKHRRLLTHGFMASVNTLLVRTLTFVPMLAWLVYVEQQGWGLARWLGLSGWLEFIISIIVLDAFDYFWHRANHRITFLWRFHKAHHADTQIDVSTALRFHPGELLLSSLAKATGVGIWGPSTIAWFLFEILVSWFAQAHHANWDLPDRLERVVRRVWVTPRFHAIHHLVDRRFGDANFSTLLSVWDPCFGTEAEALSRAQTKDLDLGLPEAREHTASLKQWLTEPIARRNLGLSQQRQAD